MGKLSEKRALLLKKLAQEFQELNNGEKSCFIGPTTSYYELLKIIGILLNGFMSISEKDSTILEKVYNEYNSISAQYNNIFPENREGKIKNLYLEKDNKFLEEYSNLKTKIDSLISKTDKLIKMYNDDFHFLEQEEPKRNRGWRLRIALIVSSLLIGTAPTLQSVNVGTNEDKKNRYEKEIDQFKEDDSNRDKSEFLKRIDARGFEYVEYIDGVIIIHTRIYEFEVDKNKKIHKREILKMYDMYGNRFYNNCYSREEAEELVEKLKKEGKNAIIGPKTPWRGKDGQLIINESEDAVGVYIVETKDYKESEYNIIESNNSIKINRDFRRALTPKQFKTATNGELRSRMTLNEANDATEKSMNHKHRDGSTR